MTESIQGSDAKLLPPLEGDLTTPLLQIGTTDLGVISRCNNLILSQKKILKLLNIVVPTEAELDV